MELVVIWGNKANVKEMEEGVTAFVKVLTEWLAATFSPLKSCVKMIFIFSSEFFLLFVRIESLPGVQAEDPVAQIFMGRSADCPQYGVQDDHHDHNDHLYDFDDQNVFQLKPSLAECI